jgi:hypothetical protein
MAARAGADPHVPIGRRDGEAANPAQGGFIRDFAPIRGADR